MISIVQKGDFRKANRFLERLAEGVKLGELDKYGKLGVEALRSATPVDTGKTADSWFYEISRSSGGNITISWGNSNVNEGCNIAILLQYGHGTGNGAYVRGRDYINPAIQPIFEEIAESAWKELTK